MNADSWINADFWKERQDGPKAALRCKFLSANRISPINAQYPGSLNQEQSALIHQSAFICASSCLRIVASATPGRGRPVPRCRKNANLHKQQLLTLMNADSWMNADFGKNTRMAQSR